MKLTRRTFSAGLAAMPFAARAALPKLPPIAETDALLLQPGDARTAQYEQAYNERTELRPALRIMAKTGRGVAQSIDWLRTNHVPFALRSGGHSFEGFSQSASAVIDVRLMNDIALDGNTLSVGAGTPLGAIYKFVAPRGLDFPGGSCPTVGVSGHAMGGGFGLIARDRGLACDRLVSVDLIGADAKTLRADAATNPDLFWALRGGGGGSFGAATRLQFRVEPIGRIQVYSATWTLDEKRAADLFDAWQDWAPQAPDHITGIFKLSRPRTGRVVLHIAGESTGSAAELRRELRALTDLAEPSTDLSISSMSFLGAVNHFSGGWAYETGYSKAKSDFITARLPRAGIEALIGHMPASVIAICDAHGGAIGRVPEDATAFAYRAGTRFCIQYYTSWSSASAAAGRLADIRGLYAAMRPWSGGSYVNYCDLDLQDWEKAYWRQNLARLKSVKARIDPDDFFHHAQSVMGS
jgi:FAD/FMN-containing dehydrogenase